MAKSDAGKFNPEEMAAKAAENPGFIRELLDGLSAKDSSKLRRAKALNLLSSSHPEALYPFYESIAGLLDSPHNILKWNAILILGNLAGVDKEHRFDIIFDRYYRHLWDGDLITAANIAGASGKIAIARPDLQDRITAEILKVDVIPLPTDECREIARGKAVLALGEYLTDTGSNKAVKEFVGKCLNSRRPATRKKAEALIAKQSRSEGFMYNSPRI